MRWNFARYKLSNIATEKLLILSPMRRAELPVSQLHHLLLYVYYVREMRTLRKASYLLQASCSAIYIHIIYILYVHFSVTPFLFRLLSFSFPLSLLLFPFPFFPSLLYIYIQYVLKCVPFPLPLYIHYTYFPFLYICSRICSRICTYILSCICTSFVLPLYLYCADCYFLLNLSPFSAVYLLIYIVIYVHIICTYIMQIYTSLFVDKQKNIGESIKFCAPRIFSYKYVQKICTYICTYIPGKQNGEEERTRNTYY